VIAHKKKENHLPNFRRPIDDVKPIPNFLFFFFAVDAWPSNADNKRSPM